MKLTFHLNKKNVLAGIAGVSTVVLTAIAIIVPPERWVIPPWKWISLGFFGAAVIGAIAMVFIQSREDHERDEKEGKRDAAQDTLRTQVAQLAARGEEKSLAVAQTTQTALSSLTPGVDFKFADYFRTSHMSQLTEQTATDIKILVKQQYPNDVEDVLAKFIGIGFWAYAHETTWPYIFRSQILALTELNARGGIMPLVGIKAHFDKAAADNPDTYAHYTFDQWMNFMLTHGLFLTRPGDVIEITLRGRDFLTFVAHWGWSSDAKRN
ncbi:MAG: hypothetical protein WA738_08900 [Candidatus Angelobacter sp.]